MKKMMLLFAMLVMVASVSAENYVNWDGGFWLAFPDDWDKVDYQTVDRYLMYTDTSRDIFDYEAVYAPESLAVFAADAYVVITFEETAEMTKRETDSVLELISRTYSTDVSSAPIVELMTDLVPGQPKINYRQRSISVLSDMAYRPGAIRKVWQYMRFNDKGLITLYFFSPDSTYAVNKPIFDDILKSLSFENLKEAAGEEALTFTDVGGDQLADPEMSGRSEAIDDPPAAEGIATVKNILIIAVIIIIVFGLIWNFVIVPRTKKKSKPSE